MKKEFKGFICGIVLTALLGCSAGAVGTWDNISVLRNDIKIVVNGSEIAADNFLYNDTTYLPLRAVSEALNQVVAYDENTNIAYIGEREEDEVMQSKYTPPESLNNFISKKDGIYYIEPTYILDKAAEKGLQTNIDDLIGNDNLNLEIDGKTWYMVFVYESRYIPYDTFVDEIEPLLK